MSRPTLSWERVRGRVTLRDLHILAAVVQWGSMARGAAHLGLSQPSVSEAVAKLEAALCVRLLDRSPRGSNRRCTDAPCSAVPTSFLTKARAFPG